MVMTEKSDDEPETGARKQPCVCMGEVCAWVRCVYMGRVCMCGWSESFYTRSIIVYGASTTIADNHTRAYTLDARIHNQPVGSICVFVNPVGSFFEIATGLKT